MASRAAGGQCALFLGRAGGARGWAALKVWAQVPPLGPVCLPFHTRNPQVRGPGASTGRGDTLILQDPNSPPSKGDSLQPAPHPV